MRHDVLQWMEATTIMMKAAALQWIMHPISPGRNSCIGMILIYCSDGTT